MSIEIKYMPLSFINTDEEILKQIKNTVLFSYLFQEFEETSLSHYLESTQYGYTASASEIGTHQLVRITDINSGKVDWNTVPFCDCEAETKYLLKDNDILVARTGGTTGKSFIVSSAPNNAIFASYLIRLRLKNEVNLEFINLYLNSYAFWSQIVEMKSGSAMPNVNAEKLKTLRIPKISFEEQSDFVTAFKNIEKAENLNSLFDKINEVESLFINSKKTVNELTHQLDLIKQLRQSFLREAMQGKLVKSYVTQETGQQLLAKIKVEKAQLIAEKKLKKEKELAPISEDEIPFEIPEHWVWCRLGDVVNEILGGYAFDSTKYSKTETNNQVIRLGNVKPNQLVLNTNPVFINDDYANEANKTILKVGDILITMTGTRAKRDYLFSLCLSEDDFKTKNLFLNQRVGCFRFPELISTNFINVLLKDSKLIEPIFESSTGAANQANIGITALKETIFPLPPLHEQEQIVAKLESLMKFCDGLEQSIKESQGYNEMLLQQVLREALQGEVRE
ncbi:MAG: type I restriction enzyme S subunit [Flavobacteriales bacterium]|jgi:type I restriction enzyme S subunit